MEKGNVKYLEKFECFTQSKKSTIIQTMWMEEII